MKRPFIATLPALLFITVIPVFAKVADPLPERPSGTVRLLCLAPNLPSKLTRLPGGSFVGVPRDFDETAPATVHIRIGEDYRPLPSFQSGYITAPVRLPTSAKPGPEGFYFSTPKDNRPQSPLSGLVSVASKKTGDSTGLSKQELDWHPLARMPDADGKDHLLCLFSLNASRWYPPSTLDVDISSEAFPEGRCLLLNLSSRPVLIQLGGGAKPVAVAAKGGKNLSAFPGGDSEVRMKVVAVDAANTPVPVFNRARKIPKGFRGLLVVSEAHAGEGLPVTVRFLEIAAPAARALFAATADRR